MSEVRMDEHQSGLQWVLDWWGVIIFAGSMITGFLLGNARKGWSLQNLEDRVGKLEARVEAGNERASDLNTSIAVLTNQVSQLNTAIVNLNNRIERLKE